MVTINYAWAKSVRSRTENALRALCTCAYTCTDVLKGNSTGKWISHMLGFGLVSGFVKVFPVSSLSLARKSTWKKRARRSLMTKWDPKSRDRLLFGPDRTWAIARELAGACDRSSNRESRPWTTRNSTRIAMLWPAAVRSPTPSPAQRWDGHATWDPISSSGHVVLVSSWLIFSRTKEIWQTFTMPLTSSNPNMCEINFPVVLPFNQIQLTCVMNLTFFFSNCTAACGLCGSSTCQCYSLRFVACFVTNFNTPKVCNHSSHRSFFSSCFSCRMTQKLHPHKAI